MSKFVQDLEETRVHAQHLNAHANLLQQQRLDAKADNLHKLGLAAEKDEAKLPKTAESLGILGAGSEYGS